MGRVYLYCRWSARLPQNPPLQLLINYPVGWGGFIYIVVGRRGYRRTRPYNYQLITRWGGAGLFILSLVGEVTAEPAPTIINY
ncbi:hypothetical protein AP285_00790 [Limnospira platensis YZ]|nr:hypothetical protein AP285_00790 [Arthrospira platensis YZ]